ncbi:CLUMA_CG011317, isoform A [Clunio marinus]|uniref:CLUMA_CG011317, isoform A n=1 Tax=Clunio marinus TaxID=568069 RepID=A0A1J1ICI6_9DIPT|nr:CLUMA_CG011317, isoform A [Clunio marinus]
MSFSDGRKLFGGYKITPKFCMDAKAAKSDVKIHGPAICMFNHECVERKGRVIGACMDGIRTRSHLFYSSPINSFLFGTCCLLSGEVETSLADASSYESQELKDNTNKMKEHNNNKPLVINNQFYGSNAADEDESLYENTKIEVSNDAVVVSSPAYGEKITSSNYPTESSFQSTQYGASHSHSPGYSTELPTRIHSTTQLSDEYEMNNFPAENHFSKIPYDHSGISYSPSDAEVLSEDNLISSYPSSTPETFVTGTSTEAFDYNNNKNKFSKPIFKLKPTQSQTASTEKFVLVHTISNEKVNEANQENHTKRPSTNESIQSIILMLNGSNPGPGPEYNVDSMNNYVSGSTPSYGGGSTVMIDQDKYGSSSYYITTKIPSSSSTSYVYPTRRQPTKTTTVKNANRIKITSTTQSPPTTTPPNVPSTSYVYSPKPIRKRPTVTSSTVSPSTLIKKQTTNIVKKTTPKPLIIVKKPTSNVGGNYVVISGGGITKHPSPTVHITPKPIVNILTSSTVNQMSNIQTKRPSGINAPKPSSSVTERPVFMSTTPGTFISSSIYVPAIQDFHNEGYFVVTHQPAAAGVSSTAVYTINSGILNSNDVKLSENDSVDLNDETSVINNDDLSNFPPVRNPNLNLTAVNTVINEAEISTPEFVDDEKLTSKIDLLVTKLVASMQGNLENLIDIVYERKNVTTVEQNLINVKKNGTIQATKPTKVSNTKPSNVKVTTKAPTRGTTGRPSQQTTKKTATKATTKKPSTAIKKPTSKPGSNNSQTSKKPPARVTTTVSTKKPTRKVTTTTTSTTERAPANDELIQEEGEDGATGENEDENVVDESEVEATPAPLENGRIQCGVRPHYKSGRIVGGKASAFGEFPWQVLVRESTWLGLFTKNKCGGVLISNNYVVTAAHCQPGFLASLVAVFGEYDISGDLESKRSVSKNVKRVIVHRQYDAATFENDLAILELESPIRYDTHIVPICMPPDGAEFTGKVATVSGWGRLKYGGGVPSVLQEVQVPIIENSVCQEMFAAAGHTKKILSSFLCAGYANGQKDSKWDGDSGGPLVMQRSDGRYQLVGTVSHGIKCASPLLPGVYMRTNFYKPWIKSITGIK